MTGKQFNVADPVWSKMKGYCPWPSRIASSTESTLENKAPDKIKNSKPHYLVYFFGSNNFAWMAEDTIKPYHENKDKNEKGSKTVQFKLGLQQINEYVNKGGREALLEELAKASNKNSNSTNNDDAVSSSGEGDELSNDNSTHEGDLPSMEEEIAAINSKKPTNVGKKPKSSNDPQNDLLSSPTPVQKDYSRTPFKSRKSVAKSEEPELTSPTKRVKLNDDDSYDSARLSPTVSTTTTLNTSAKPATGKSVGARNVIFRAAQYVDAPIVDTPQMSTGSVSAKLKSIRPSSLKFGFIGVGFMGQRLLKNLLNSGHQVTIWNRTKNKCKEFVEAGAETVETPSDVVTAADIVFSCLSDPAASKEVVFGPFGVLSQMESDKAYVEMSAIDHDTSNDISEAILGKGGRYLEAPMIVHGKKAAERGDLIIVAAGDRTLYEDCSSCFQAMTKQTFFLGHTIGKAVKMNMICSTVYGNMVGALVEASTMAEMSGLELRELKEILKLSVMNCPLTIQVLDKIIYKDGATEVPLGHLQKDLRLALNHAETLAQTCPITATTNEVMKNSKKFSSTDNDVSTIYQRYRF